MVQTQRHRIQKHFSSKIKSLTLLFVASTLTGCYVEVGHEIETDYDTDVDHSTHITHFSTQLLVDTAVTPLVLSAESAGMVINPDAYTTPRSRAMTRSIIVETTYSELFDNWNCDYGGYTRIEADANTSSYDDDFVHVDLSLNSRAYDCEIRQGGVIHRINSDLSYNVEGWYDNLRKQISSMDATLQGDVSVEYKGKRFAHKYLDLQVKNQSSEDLKIDGSSRLSVNDGYYGDRARMTTSNSVHTYVGGTHPYYGTVRLSDGDEWVSLNFEESGVWRTDSNGYQHYSSWSILGY